MVRNYVNKKHLLYLAIGAVVILLNTIAWRSTAFCDIYIANIFPIWVNTYGRITGIFPFSVGEIMLGLAVVLSAFALCAWIGLFWKGLRKMIKGFYRFYAWTFIIVCLIMTLNCFILYHATTFSETYFGKTTSSDYTIEELIEVRNLVVEKCNELAQTMARDEEGMILYEGDMKGNAIYSMEKLGETYDRLSGYYPNPKPLYTSDFFCQQYMCGYYFPFSMEANYNNVMYIMNLPSTLCHELAHLKGYIFEDEASFISFLACTQSEDLVFQYSGYLSVLYYLDNDFYDAVGRNWELYAAQPAISAQVHQDNIFLSAEEWDRINGKALIDTEIVEEISDVVVDTSLKVNGVSGGMISYNRVVELLLHYYKLQGKI